jgi:hypothetical protein
MAYLIPLAVATIMSCLCEKGHTKAREAYERDQQFVEKESIDILKTQRLPKEHNARINTGLHMRSGFANIIEKVQISRYFEILETDLHNVEIASCIDYTVTWSSKQVHRLPQYQSSCCRTNNSVFEDR